MPMTSLSSDCGLVTHWTKEDIAYHAFRTAVWHVPAWLALDWVNIPPRFVNVGF
jgi:hypothetical protein